MMYEIYYYLSSSNYNLGGVTLRYEITVDLNIGDGLGW